MSVISDPITEALTQKLEEREYDSEGNWLFPQLTREDSVEILEQLCSEVGLTEFEYPAHTQDVLMLTELARDLDVAPPTVWRWWRKGILNVRLETFMMGGRRQTTREAYARFVEATTQAADGEQAKTPIRR